MVTGTSSWTPVTPAFRLRLWRIHGKEKRKAADEIKKDFDFKIFALW